MIWKQFKQIKRGFPLEENKFIILLLSSLKLIQVGLFELHDSTSKLLLRPHVTSTFS